MKRRCCEQYDEKIPAGYLLELSNAINASYGDGIGVNNSDTFNLPRRGEVESLIEKLQEIVFPGYKMVCVDSALRARADELLSEIYPLLYSLSLRAFNYHCKTSEKIEGCAAVEKAEAATRDLLDNIARVREIAKLDVKASFDGDPAAASYDEIVLGYPGLEALVIQRFAHILFHHDMPLVPRMMTEIAHSWTGIDIHPGAHIGKGIFIDHGTGVVVGETATIGDNVKIYQGVTLGALSFPKDACGMIIKGAKRHPSIEDDVTIYAGATVLGDITVGHHSVIGGNVWITEDLEPYSKVLLSSPNQQVKKLKK